MNRFRLAVAAMAAALLAIVLSNCASVQHNPLYDSGFVSLADSTTLVPIQITNSRVTDGIDPHFYFISNGRHQLGVVRGMGETKIIFVDSRWIRPDGVITIVAHYAGGPDLVYEQFIWKPGQRIDVSLNNIFNPVAAWAHR